MKNLVDAPFDWDKELKLLYGFLNQRLPEEEAALEGKDIGIFNVYQLEGFFAALYTMPEFVPPSKWLPVMWGDFPPVFESMKEAEEIMSLPMRFYNEVAWLLRERDFLPMWADVDEENYQNIIDALAEGGTPVQAPLLPVVMWLNGYVEALSHFSPKTMAVLKAIEKQSDQLDEGLSLSEENEVLAWAIGAPMNIIHALLDQIYNDAPLPLPKLDTKEAELILEGLEQWPSYLYETLEPEREKVRQAHAVQSSRPKVGRNDPCPCGSGKKYKKCCLH